MGYIWGKKEQYIPVHSLVGWIMGYGPIGSLLGVHITTTLIRFNDSRSQREKKKTMTLVLG